MVRLKGSSIIEVLVATLIVMIAVSVSFQLFSSVWRSRIDRNFFVNDYHVEKILFNKDAPHKEEIVIKKEEKDSLKYIHVEIKEDNKAVLYYDMILHEN